MKDYYLAIDIGASSGRHVIGWEKEGKIETEEIYRFPNGVTEWDGHLVWDIKALLKNVQEGITRAKKKYARIESLSIDTWGVDYVLMKGDKEVWPCYAYRDHRTEAVINRVHEKMNFSDLYRRTGIQFQPFNTIYQLFADKISGRLDEATDFLMIPEYLMYKLCGIKSHEYTNATTGGIVNVKTGQYDMDIVNALQLPAHLFCSLQQPGTVIGEYEGIKVKLCATHDTASAVEGIMMDGNHPYISSGTWSLLGIKTKKPLTDDVSEQANWSNEGGVNYNRYQKNIMGMWVVNRLREELCPNMGFEEIVRIAEKSECDFWCDINATEFLAPKSMKETFDNASNCRLKDVGDYFRCAYLSLAHSYKQALEELEKNTKNQYEKLFIVGGGAKNELLNGFTKDATGKEVIALPMEATALGNLKIQMGMGGI